MTHSIGHFERGSKKRETRDETCNHRKVHPASYPRIGCPATTNEPTRLSCLKVAEPRSHTIFASHLAATVTAERKVAQNAHDALEIFARTTSLRTLRHHRPRAVSRQSSHRTSSQQLSYLKAALQRRAPDRKSVAKLQRQCGVFLVLMQWNGLLPQRLA